MKRLIFISVLVFSSVMSFAQSDTLFTSKGQKISCKIYEIGEYEVRYRLATALDGPLYVIDKTTIIKYTLSNGFTERLLPDEMSLQNEHKDILSNRQVIKIQPFGIAFNHISLSYEKVIKVGMNLDIEAGYINSTLAGSNSISNINNINYYSGNTPFTTGAYIKPGIKFFLGQDFSVKGLKYAHPLKGRYIKLDLAVSYLNFQNMQTTLYGNTYLAQSTNTIITTDLNSVSYGGFVNYGRQFILGNILTLDYYIGVGFTGQSYSYSNPNYLTAINQIYGGYYGIDQVPNISNYYGFLRVPSFGLSFTTGFRIGYIIPAKKDYKKKTPVTYN